MESGNLNLEFSDSDDEKGDALEQQFHDSLKTGKPKKDDLLNIYKDPKKEESLPECDSLPILLLDSVCSLSAFSTDDNVTEPSFSNGIKRKKDHTSHEKGLEVQKKFVRIKAEVEELVHPNKNIISPAPQPIPILPLHGIKNEVAQDSDLEEDSICLEDDNEVMIPQADADADKNGLSTHQLFVYEPFQPLVMQAIPCEATNSRTSPICSEEPSILPLKNCLPPSPQKPTSFITSETNSVDKSRRNKQVREGPPQKRSNAKEKLTEALARKKQLQIKNQNLVRLVQQLTGESDVSGLMNVVASESGSNTALNKDDNYLSRDEKDPLEVSVKGRRRASKNAADHKDGSHRRKTKLVEIEEENEVLIRQNNRLCQLVEEQMTAHKTVRKTVAPASTPTTDVHT